jgi:hypothetical protein
LFVCVQPVDGLQASVVQTLPSSQFGAGPPTQVPPEQVSLVVQALPSLQGAVLLVCVQPVEGLQASSVQGLLSLQLVAEPGTQAPPEQTSPVVQALPSLHGSVLFVCVQPVAELQASVVQGLLSLQLGAGPPTHVPPEQVSFVVQASPSSQGSVLFVWLQPVTGLHVSVVQGLPSSQLTGVPPPHVPPEQMLSVVHALPVLHGAALFVCTHPDAGLQLSSVHTLPSLQSTAGPGWHVPPPQTSLDVQALPSSHGAVLLAWVQPVAGLQASSVQGLLSLQLGAGPPTHVPPEHVSLAVQAFPSLQGAVLLV